MLAHEGVAKYRVEAVVLPARVRHHPIEVVERARDQQIRVALRLREGIVDRRMVLAIDMRDDRPAVADHLAVVDDVGQLPARRRRGIEDVLVLERHAGELEEGIDLQPIAVVVGDTEEGRVGVQGEHGRL